jgi:hypothetical protein
MLIGIRIEQIVYRRLNIVHVGQIQLHAGRMVAQVRRAQFVQLVRQVVEIGRVLERIETRVFVQIVAFDGQEAFDAMQVKVRVEKFDNLI